MSMIHPLSCSHAFGISKSLDMIGQSFHVPGHIPFAVCSTLSQSLCYTPLSLPLFYPSHMTYLLAGNNENTLGKIAWIAPVSGVFLLNLIGRVSYDLMSNSFLKGTVYGLHSTAMGMLTNIPSGGWAGLITLRKVLGSYTQLPSALKQLSKNSVDSIGKKSEIVSSATFITASLAASFFGGFHVMTANMIGHIAAAITKVASAHLLIAFTKTTPETTS